MQLEVQVLSDDEIKLVHQRTMEILETAGIWIKSPVAFEMLKKAGARTDDERQIVFISEDMVTDALAKAPKTFKLGGRNHRFDLTLPTSESRHQMSGIATAIYDIETGEKRDAVISDIIDIGRVFQKTETGALCWTGVTASDVPQKTHNLHEMAAIIQGTSKHVQVELSSTYEASFAARILEAVCGSREKVIEDKIASFLYCPVSPLTQDRKMLEAYLSLAEYEIPITIYPMPIIGLTSPASLFSTLCQINAEVLSAIVIFQTAHPGWPVIYGTASGAADPMTGEYVRSGEAPLISMGGTAMARFYGLPCAVTGGGSFETMPAYLGNPDLIDGLGAIECGMAVDLRAILADEETGKRCMRIRKGIRIGEGTDLTEDIIKEGPGGGFLMHRSTMKNFRNNDEIYHNMVYPLNKRAQIDEVEANREAAGRIVKQILAGPHEDALPEDVLQKIRDILDEADGELTEKVSII
ncbi:MAG: trimethylamine methyltransferase family protein [Firmicutes bacterium]|nr:trimethylamine methyltransferase family protein [Bacillota bacterium]